MSDLDIFIHVPVLVVDVAAADHGHQSKHWVVHEEEDNSLQRLYVPGPASSSYEHIVCEDNCPFS